MKNKKNGNEDRYCLLSWNDEYMDMEFHAGPGTEEEMQQEMKALVVERMAALGLADGDEDENSLLYDELLRAEDEKERISISETGASLIISGGYEERYQIVPYVSAVTKQVHTGEIHVAPERAAFIREKLTHIPESESERYSEEFTFDDGKLMIVELCGVRFLEGEDESNRPWTQAVLYDAGGFEIAFTEPSDKFDGEWELEDGDDVYRVTVHFQDCLSIDYWLTDVKSEVCLDGILMAQDYCNTYHSEKEAVEAAMREAKRPETLEVSVHHWLILEDGSQEHAENNENGYEDIPYRYKKNDK